MLGVKKNCIFALGVEAACSWFLVLSFFFQIEVRNVRDWILARTDKIVFFQTLHSYGQLILFPW